MFFHQIHRALPHGAVAGERFPERRQRDKRQQRKAGCDAGELKPQRIGHRDRRASRLQQVVAVEMLQRHGAESASLARIFPDFALSPLALY